MENSVFKPIRGFEEYWVSNKGEVYSAKSKKYLKPYRSKLGYTYINLYKDGKKHIKSIHRLVAAAFLPDYSDNLEVDHLNCVRDDNRVENLRMCTRKENCNNPNTLKNHKDSNGARCRDICRIGGRANGVKTAKPIIIDGVEFESLNEAARQLGINPGIIHYRLNSLYYPEYNYK